MSNIEILLNYKERLLTKKQRTPQEEKMLAKIIKLLILLDKHLKDDITVNDTVELRKMLSMIIPASTLPLKVDERNLASIDKYLMIDGKSTTIYTLQTYLDAPVHYLSEKTNSKGLIENAINMFEEQIDRILADKKLIFMSKEELKYRNIFLDDFKEKREIVDSIRKDLYEELFTLEGPYCFGELTEIQKNKILYKPSFITLKRSTDIITYYTTLDELEDVYENNSKRIKLMKRFQKR